MQSGQAFRQCVLDEVLIVSDEDSIVHIIISSSQQQLSFLCIPPVGAHYVKFSHTLGPVRLPHYDFTVSYGDLSLPPLSLNWRKCRDLRGNLLLHQSPCSDLAAYYSKILRPVFVNKGSMKHNYPKTTGMCIISSSSTNCLTILQFEVLH